MWVGSSGLVSGRPTPLHGHLGTASFSLLGGLLSIGSQDRTIRCPRSGRLAFPKRKMDCVRRAGTWNSRGTFSWTWPAHTGLYWNRRAAPLEPRRRLGRPLYHQLASFKYCFSTHAYYRLGCGFGPPLTTQRSGRNFPPDRLVSEHRKEFPSGWSADASVTGLWKGCPSLRSNHEGTMAEHIPATFEMDWSADKPNVISEPLLEEMGGPLVNVFWAAAMSHDWIGFASSTRTSGTKFSFLCRHSQSSW
jgi:hypothetical protein